MLRSYVLDRGKPPYQPRGLGALYLFGILHRLRSSRQLEDACQARRDAIWLMRGQTPAAIRCAAKRKLSRGKRI